VVFRAVIVRSFGQWAAATCAAPPTASAGQYATSNCKPLLFGFPCKWRYMLGPLTFTGGRGGGKKPEDDKFSHFRSALRQTVGRNGRSIYRPIACDVSCVKTVIRSVCSLLQRLVDVAEISYANYNVSQPLPVCISSLLASRTLCFTLVCWFAHYHYYLK